MFVDTTQSILDVLLVRNTQFSFKFLIPQQGSNPIRCLCFVSLGPILKVANEYGGCRTATLKGPTFEFSYGHLTARTIVRGFGHATTVANAASLGPRHSGTEELKKSQNFT